jgi:hypothetical protein
MAAPAAAVVVDGQSNTLTPLLPARGAYYDSTKSGTGIMVDVGQNGYVFLTYFGYDGMGVPTWYTVQGQWSPSTEVQRLTTGVIGTLSQPLLRASGGQCLTCDFTTKPTITPQPYTLSASWTTPRHVDVTIGTQAWHMDAGQFGIGDADLPTGTWLASVSWGYDSRLVFVAAQSVPTQTGVVVIGEKSQLSGPPVGVIEVLDTNADPSIQLPPQTSYFYSLSGRGTCPPLPGQQPPSSGAFVDLVSATAQSPYYSSNGYVTPVLWYEPSTHRGGLDMITHFMGVDQITMVFGPNNVHFDVYVEPDRIVGHGVVQGANFNGIPGTYWAPNSVTLNLVMQRLPAAVNEGRVREYICPI